MKDLQLFSQWDEIDALELNHNVHNTRRTIARDFWLPVDEIMKSKDSLQRVALLNILAVSDWVSQIDLTRLSWIDRSTISAMMNVLEKAGYVRNTRSTRDARSVEAFITPAWKEILQQLNEAWISSNSRDLETTLETLKETVWKTLRA